MGELNGSIDLNPTLIWTTHDIHFMATKSEEGFAIGFIRTTSITLNNGRRSVCLGLCPTYPIYEPKTSIKLSGIFIANTKYS